LRGDRLLGESGDSQGRDGGVDRSVVARLTEHVIALDLQGLGEHFALLDLDPPFVQWSPDIGAGHDERLRKMSEVWSALPVGRRFPRSRALDPVQLRPAIGHVMLLDVLDDGWDFRFRVFGSAVADSVGFDLHGKRISELPDAGLPEFLIATLRACMLRGESMYTRHRPPAEYRMDAWDRVLLPLEEEDGNIHRFLVGNVAVELPAKSARPA
jgi:hypothetical protein